MEEDTTSRRSVLSALGVPTRSRSRGSTSTTSFLVNSDPERADAIGSSTSASPSMNQQNLLPPPPTEEYGYSNPNNHTPSPTFRDRENEEGHFRRGPSTPGVRISRMLMGKPGGPPPPPGPPRPPPLPPYSSHPFAQPSLVTQRSSSLLPPLPAGPSNHGQPRVSMINTNPNRTSRLPPLAPPPTTSLPPTPQQQGAHRRQTSITSSISSSGSRTRHISGRSSNSGHPPISPRSSSLLSPAYAIQARHASSMASTSTSTAGHTPAAPSRQPPRPREVGRPNHSGRTPSRELLQGALDLAQQAVEKDRGNDVDGALQAYYDAVEKLKEVMERVGSGPPRPGDQAEVAAKAEQEGRTLRGIHDAYLARIALLKSYDRPIPNYGESSMESASMRSASMLDGDDEDGDRNERNGGDRTPTRTSLDETAHVGIGNMMLDDDQSALTTPSRDWVNESPRTPNRPQEQPSSPTPPPKALPSSPSNFTIPLETSTSGSLSLQQALDNAADSAIEETVTAGSSRPGSHSQLGLGHPSTSPRAVIAAPNPNVARTSISGISASDITPSRKRELLRARLASERTNFMDSEDYEEGMTGSRSRSSLSQVLNQDADSPRMATGESASTDLTRSSSASTSAQGATLSPPLERGASHGSERSVGNDDLTPSKKRELLRQKAAGYIEMMNTGNYDEEMLGMNHSRQHSLAESSTSRDDKSLPALPLSNPPLPSSPRRSNVGSLMQPRIDGLLVSPITTAGRIAQRRLSRQPGQPGHSSISSMTEIAPSSSIFPSGPSGRSISTANSSPQSHSHTPRTRSKSQPGTRPDLFRNITDANNAPPLPSIPRKVSTQYPRNLAVHTNGLAPPQPISSSATSSRSIAQSVSSSLMSPVPEPQPAEAIHRPFHLLRILSSSMDPNGPGAYLTGGIHISPHIWQTSIHTRGAASKNQFRILAQDTKVRCMESLIINLEIVRATGIPLLDGPRELKYGAPLTHVPPPRAGEGLGRIAEDFAQALDALEDEMDQSYKLLFKAGVAVNGWKGKKSGLNSKSWGSRLTRSMDKMTNSKAIDSSDKYVQLLHHFCTSIQGLEDHLYNFTGPCAPSYHYLDSRTRSQIEGRVMKAAEFASAVVVPFVLDDFKQFFSRYLKGGVKYLED